MELVKLEEIKKLFGLSKYGKMGDWTSSCLMHISKINKINKIYKKIQHLSGLDFLNAVIKEFNLKYEINCEDLKRIPKNGPFITVSNHPLGALDGILLIKIVSKIRPDYKILANFLLERVKPIQQYIFLVNPFEYYNKSSISVLKEALNYIKKGYAIGMFPAGEVSSIQKTTGKICDRNWPESAIKFVVKTKSPVIPIYFHGKNSKIFYHFGRINEYLRTAMLPFEMFNQKGKIIKIRIGNPIFNKEYENIREYSNFLKKKTYIFSNVYNKKKSNFWIRRKKINSILPAINKELLQNDIYNLNSSNLVLNNSKYQIFFTKAISIPNILKEIGRLRELSFREVGQGTNKSIDLDKYDQYYHHLFLWEKNKKQIIGAYRIGFGKEIFDKKGINGFYLTKFFFFDKKIFFLFKNSIEMGRVFLIKEYQKKTLPLFLLWKSILKLILRYPEYKYLIGLVGISKELSDFSISIIVEFIKLHFYDNYLSKYVFPKNKYKVNIEYSDKNFILNESKNDLDKFDKLIDEIEPGKVKLPILIKKYIKKNAKVISFNVDKEFNNSTDGLMYIKIPDLYK